MAYSQEDKERIVKTVCETMEKDSVSFRQACVIANVPNSTVLGWIDQDEDFSEQYTRARGNLLDNVADEILQIADNSEFDTYEDDGVTKTNNEVIARSRLRVDSRKWLLSKMMPKKFGDKIQTENKHSGSIAISKIEREIVDPKNTNG